MPSMKIIFFSEIELISISPLLLPALRVFFMVLSGEFSRFSNSDTKNDALELQINLKLLSHRGNEILVIFIN